jgi:hypothetical protein
MHKRPTTKSSGSGDIGAGDFRMIALTLIDPPPTNTRTIFKEQSLDELTTSIKQKGFYNRFLCGRSKRPAPNR